LIIYEKETMGRKAYWFVSIEAAGIKFLKLRL
jgi:hypothetical protein